METGVGDFTAELTCILLLDVVDDELFSENFKIKVSDDGMFYEVVGKVS